MEITDKQRLAHLVKMKKKILITFELLAKEQAIMQLYDLIVMTFSSHKDYMNHQRKLIDDFINEDAAIRAMESREK